MDSTLERAVNRLHKAPAIIQKICLNVDKSDQAIEPEEGKFQHINLPAECEFSIIFYSDIKQSKYINF